MAEERGTLCFVEVKSRKTDACGLPQEAVSRSKRRKLSKAALFYLAGTGSIDRQARFDVVAVFHTDEGCSFELFKNAFDLGE